MARAMPSLALVPDLIEDDEDCDCDPGGPGPGKRLRFDNTACGVLERAQKFLETYTIPEGPIHYSDFGNWRSAVIMGYERLLLATGMDDNMVVHVERLCSRRIVLSEVFAGTGSAAIALHMWQYFLRAEFNSQLEVLAYSVTEPDETAKIALDGHDTRSAHAFENLLDRWPSTLNVEGTLREMIAEQKVLAMAEHHATGKAKTKCMEEHGEIFFRKACAMLREVPCNQELKLPCSRRGDENNKNNNDNNNNKNNNNKNNKKNNKNNNTNDDKQQVWPRLPCVSRARRQ